MALRRSKPKPRMKGKLFTKQDDKLPPIVEVKSAYRTYRESQVPVKALNGVSLKVNRGEMVAIMGPSGSGKTTLLNILGLLDYPDEGKVLFAGEDLGEMKRRKVPIFRQKEIGMIFQQKNLIPTLTAFENVYLPFRYSRGKRGFKKDQAEEALRMVDMIDRRDHNPSQLSGGEQQRVAIARALVLSPAVVLADEPTGELDSKTGQKVVTLMEDLNRQTGQTFILVTHNPMVADVCHRLVQMRDGRVTEKPKRRKR